MIFKDAQNSVLQIEKIDSLDAGLKEKIVSIFPDDNLKKRRSSNISKAKFIIVAKKNDEIAGVLYIRNILSIPNVTWMVSKSFQKQGVGLALVEEARKHYSFITAISRNTASVKLARKAGFIVLPFGIGFCLGKKS